MKKFLLISALALGLLMLMSSECNNSDPVDPDCNGIITLSATGYFTDNFCMDVLVDYEFIENEKVYILAREDRGDESYSFSIDLYNYNGPGTYDLSVDLDNGFAELIIHGNETEFYKVQSGSVTVTKADATTFEASFNLTTKGFYNEASLNTSGSVSKK